MPKYPDRTVAVIAPQQPRSGSRHNFYEADGERVWCYGRFTRTEITTEIEAPGPCVFKSAPRATAAACDRYRPRSAHRRTRNTNINAKKGRGCVRVNQVSCHQAARRGPVSGYRQIRANSHVNKFRLINCAERAPCPWPSGKFGVPWRS